MFSSRAKSRKVLRQRHVKRRFARLRARRQAIDTIEVRLSSDAGRLYSAPWCKMPLRPNICRSPWGPDVYSTYRPKRQIFFRAFGRDLLILLLPELLFIIAQGSPQVNGKPVWVHAG
jgi:hypothetical protein